MALTKPTGVEVSNQDCDSADLSWEPVDGATDYQVRKDGFPAGESTSQTMLTVHLFQDGETHTYQIVAMAFPSESEPSEPIAIEDCSFP